MTDLPLIVQTQDNMSVDLVVKIYQTVPTARNVKDEAIAGGGALQRITEIRRRTNDEMKVFSGQGVRTMITEMELGFSGHCPVVALADVYAAAFDLWHAGKRQEAFDMFGRILAFDSLGSTDRDGVMIARGVFKPGPVPQCAGRRGRGQPAGNRRRRRTPRRWRRAQRRRWRRGGGGGAAAARRSTTPVLRDALDNYLKPYLRG